MNKTWHQQHPMKKNATLEERLTWHAAHQVACHCRPVPRSIEMLLKKRRSSK